MSQTFTVQSPEQVAMLASPLIMGSGEREGLERQQAGA